MLGRLEQHPRSLRATTRLFAAMHGAMTDSIITAWRQKYDAGFWRPFQAIHGADTDGNPATVPDPAWAPLIPNPPYSDHLSGHAAITAPAIEVIRRLLGEETPLTLSSKITGTERAYATLSQSSTRPSTPASGAGCTSAMPWSTATRWAARPRSRPCA